MKKILLTIVGVFVIMGLSSSPVPTQSDFYGAVDYIKEHVSGVDQTGLIPDVDLIVSTHTMYLLDTETYGLTVCPEDYGKIKNLAKIVFGFDIPEPKNNKCYILLSPFYQRGDIFWSGVLIHETCHVLDKRYKGGCRCDPFSVQYLFYLENNETEYSGKIFNWKYHDYNRKCKLKSKWGTADR